MMDDKESRKYDNRKKKQMKEFTQLHGKRYKIDRRLFIDTRNYNLLIVVSPFYHN